MEGIVILTENERRAVESCLSLTERGDPAYASRIRSNLEALDELAQAISRYPSVLGSQELGNRPRSPETLVRRLCAGSRFRRTLHIPTRAVLGKSFLIAKINFLSMLSYVFDLFENVAEVDAVRDLNVGNIFALMNEDVFLAILESDAAEPELKEKAAYELINVWEGRLSGRHTEYAAALFSMWYARRDLRPIFGTLMGTSEILQLSGRIHPVWFDFLSEGTGTAGLAEALEEFIFNLSYEDLKTVRAEMQSRGLSAVTPLEAAALIGRSGMLSDFSDTDPRELYASFQERRSNAGFRRRAGIPGPTGTIEEYFVSFLLAQGKFHEIPSS